VRNLFLIGALALIGVPIFNGFWSKELLLEASLARGPWWISAGLLAGASLTALYTIRMISMVFYGPTAAQAAAPWPRWSPSGAALGLLALGTLTSWLLAGPFSRLLATSLPFHVIELKTTIALCVETLAAPATALGLAASGVGLAAWGLRDHLAALAHWPRWLIRAVRGEFGFDWLNRRLIAATHSATRTLAATQTGQLNWNIAAIAGGLAIVLAILALGA
jgi:NADH-quinone oxidoreductase subunit L